jgi:hypothetical protein
MIPVMVVDVVINAQCTMIHTLCINVAWCCGERVSCVLRHSEMSILLRCLVPTARLFPLLAGRVPWIPRLPFPKGPHTSPPHLPLQLESGLWGSVHLHCRARAWIHKHFMGAEKITFRLKRYLSLTIPAFSGFLNT